MRNKQRAATVAATSTTGTRQGVEAATSDTQHSALSISIPRRRLRALRRHLRKYQDKQEESTWMKKQLVTGDKVRVYGIIVPRLGNGFSNSDGAIFTVLATDTKTNQAILLDDRGRELVAHPKQCRRVRPRPQRRRIFVWKQTVEALFSSDIGQVSSTTISSQPTKDRVEFIEVRRPRGKA